MLINQYACVSLTHDYQKKGDNPEALEKWQILNKEQQSQHNHPPVSEVIIGPGALQKVQTPFTSQLITSIGDILFIAQAKQLQIFDRVSDLLSKEHYSQARPQKVLQFDTILALLSTQDYLIIIMPKEVSINKWTQNTLKNVSSIVTPSPLLQSNLQKLKLFLCLQNSWITINLEDLKQETGKHNYIRAFLTEDKGIIGVMKDILFVQNKYQIDTTKFISINYIFMVNTYVCICGSTGIEDDDDEDPIYSGVIIWYQLGKIISSIEDIEYHIDSRKDGDYNFKLLDDIVMIYGSNLQKTLFFKSGKQVSKYKDTEDYLQFIVAQQEEIRGLTCMQLGKSLVLAINQKIKHIARNPTIITFDKKGQLTQYEFLNFVDGMQEIIIEKQEPKLIKLNQNSFIGTQNGQIGLVENLERDLDKLKSNPFFLEIDKSKIIKGSGVVNYAIQSHLKNPSGNLLIDYEGFQIIGSMNQMIVITLQEIENMFQEKPINPLKIDISENLSEYILYFNKINGFLIVGTTLFCYLIKLNQCAQITQKSILMKVEQLKKIDVIESYIMVQDGNQTILSILENDSLKEITKQDADSACLYQENDHLHLLILNQQQLYICSDMKTVEKIQIDFQILKSDNYFIHQLYRSKIYVSYAQIQNYELGQFIFDMQSRSSINQFNSLFSRANINDSLITMESMDWAVIKITIDKLFFVAIFPNFAQEGYIFQGIDDSLFPLMDETQEIVQLPSYSNIVRGMSVLNYILPSETNIGPQPGLGYAIHYAVKYPLKFYPNILYMEHDEESNLTIHRYIMLKLTLSKNEQPCLKQFKQDQIPLQITQQPQQQQQQQQQQSQKFVPGAILTKLDQNINLLTKFCKEAQDMLKGTYENSFEAKMQLFVRQSCLDHLETTAAKLVQSYQQSSQLKQSMAQIDFHRLMKQYGGMFQNVFVKQSNAQLKEKVALVENTMLFYDKYVHHFLESIPLKNPQQIDQIIQYFESKKPNKQKKSRRIAFIDEDSNDSSLGSYVQSLKFAPKQEVKYIRIPIKNRRIVIEQNDFDLSNIVFNHTQIDQPPSFSESQNKFMQKLEKKQDLPRSIKSNNLSDLQPKTLFPNSVAKDSSQVSSGDLQEGLKTLNIQQQPRPQSQQPVSFGQGFSLNFTKQPEVSNSEQVNKTKTTLFSQPILNDQQPVVAEPKQSQSIFGNQLAQPLNQSEEDSKPTIENKPITDNKPTTENTPQLVRITSGRNPQFCESDSDASENESDLDQAVIQSKQPEQTKKVDNKVIVTTPPPQQPLFGTTPPPQQQPIFGATQAPSQQPIFSGLSQQTQPLFSSTTSQQQPLFATTQKDQDPAKEQNQTPALLQQTQVPKPQQPLTTIGQKVNNEQQLAPPTQQPMLTNQISFQQSNQPLQFGNNFLSGNQPSMQLTQQQQGPFSGLTSIGVNQNMNTNNINLNQSSFGQTASIFSSTAPKPQQPIQQIQFGLGQQQQQQLNPSIGGIFGSTQGQSSFMDQSSKLNLNFSDQVNQPRK